MAINLLSQIPTPTTNLLSQIPTPKTNTLSQIPTTSVKPPSPNASSSVTGQPTYVAPPMGVTAKSPTTNVSGPSTTLPANQTVKPSAPIDTSSFTPAQLGLLQQAASLGSGIQTTSGTLGGAAQPAPVQQPTQTQNSNPNGGVLTQAQISAAQTPAQIAAATGQPEPLAPQASTTGQTAGAYSSTNPVTQAGLLTQAANMASSPSAQYLQNSQNAQQAYQDLENYQGQVAGALNTVSNTPGPLGNQMGREANINSAAALQEQAYNQAIQAAAQQEGAATTQQNSQQGALLSVAGQTAPVLQFGQLTNPLTGQVISPSGGNSQLNTAVAQTVQLVQNGASTQDAITQTGLSNFGLPGSQALTTALQQVSNGTYNPTQQVAAAIQNAAQATSAQGTSFDLDTALKQLSTEQPLITNFLAQTGLNAQTNPSFNQALNTYYGNFLSPGNKQLMDGYFADIKKYTSQILAANTGTIPSDVAATLASFDPSSLPVDQLVPYLQGLEQLGGNQLSVSQGQQKASGGSTSAYTGTPATAVATPVVAPVQEDPGVPGKGNPVIQGLIGGTINALGGIENAITGLFHSVF